MAGSKLKRTCKTCKHTFANPASWMKHLGEGGMCRPVTVFPLYNLRCDQAGVWKSVVPKRKKK